MLPRTDNEESAINTNANTVYLVPFAPASDSLQLYEFHQEVDGGVGGGGAGELRSHYRLC